MRNQVLSRVMSTARYRITAAGVGEEPAESGSCRHRIIPLLSWDLIRVSQGYRHRGTARACMVWEGR